jgi:hypothetical protein
LAGETAQRHKEKQMATLDNHDLVLHRIRAKLYPNHLQNVEGKYIARTNNEKTLTPHDICTTITTRGGYKGSPEELLEHVNLYNAEVVYQLAPDTQHAYNRIEIRTQFTGSGDKFLKEPRIIASAFIMENM